LVPVAGRYDSIVVVDVSLGRVTSMRQDQSLPAVRRLGGLRTSGRAIGFLESGSLVTTGTLVGAAQRSQVLFNISTVRLITSDRDSARQLVLSTDSIAKITIFRPGSTEPQGAAWIPFRVNPSAAVGKSSVFVTRGSSANVREYDDRGCLKRVVAISGGLRPIPRGEYERWIDWGAGRVSDPALARRLYASLPKPEGLPAWQKLLVDANGYLWAEVFRPRDDSTSFQWNVFTPEGRAVGTVELPPHLDIMQIGADFILGRWTDADGLEYVRRYSLRK
jgi:sugar lactone lactonase YvrE